MLNPERWGCPNPVFIDFETQSECDITEYGGRYYCQHPSTRILILSTKIDSEFHVWIPDYIKCDTKRWLDGSMWPSEMKPKQPVTLHRGTKPTAILSLIGNRPLVAHNAYGFDKYIWDRFINKHDNWLDSLYLSRIAGLPGQLDKLGKQVLGTGKDRAKKLMPLLCFAKMDIWGEGYSYPLIKNGDLQAFTRYAVGDVEIISRLWDTFAELDVEADVIDTHVQVNSRGIRVDVPLLSTIEGVSRYAQTQAANEIAEMTEGRITPDKLRSIKTIHEWLESYGVRIVDEQRLDSTGKAKLSLRKEIVQRYLDSPYLIEDNLLAVKEIPPVVINVLRLRMKALRITDAKVKRAQERVESDSRIYDLISYHVAGTGRFSSQGVQIHNLPRPIKGLDVEGLLQILQKPSNDDKVNFDRIKRFLVKQQKTIDPKTNEPEVEKTITVDDVVSTLIRPSLQSKKGYVFIIADYSSIEARGIAGIADERKLINLFLKHGDPYRQFAARVYSKEEKDVTKEERQIGKVGILGLGYGMGANKLRIFAANSGVDLVKAGITADYMVDLYRDTYTRIAGWKPQKNDALATYRVGGVWKELNKAVMDCVGEGHITVAGRCQFHMKGGTLYCLLPSGRTLMYPEARIEDVIPPYAYTLNLPLVPKATVLYTSSRGVKTLFGGLIAENCLDSDTLVLTSEGYIPIIKVASSHLLWDGVAWVKSKGCIYRGQKEVGTWLGVKLTADHLIYDGSTWNTAVNVEPYSVQSLKWVANSTNLPSYRVEGGRTPNPYVNVNAEQFATLKRENLCEMTRPHVDSVAINLQAKSEVRVPHISLQYSHQSNVRNGDTFTPELCHDVITGNTEHIQTTEQDVSRYVNCGVWIERNSLNTLSLYPIGTTPNLNLIESKTTKDTNPETCEWLHEPRTQTIEEVADTYSTQETKSLLPISTECIVPNGQEGQSTITYRKDDPQNGLWISTNSVQPVYDILQSGINNRFTILTNCGPVVVHNCVQAISRDIMATALVKLNARGFNPILHVHDEIICEVPEKEADNKLRQMMEIMIDSPSWCGDWFPQEVEGYVSPRFVKSPFKGYTSLKSKDFTK